MASRSAAQCLRPSPSRLIRPRYAVPNYTRTISKPFSFSATNRMQPRIAEGQDESRITAELDSLLDNGWALNDEQIQLQKTYHFKTYTKVLDMHTSIGIRSKSANHHPIMTTDFGSLTVYWTTHHPKGITDKDTSLARYCDDQASIIGTVARSEAQKCGPSKG